jgi:hypothetical protein
MPQPARRIVMTRAGSADQIGTQTSFSSPGLPHSNRLPWAACFVLGSSVHLLYLDDSGSIVDPAQKHLVLAGFSVFERATHWIELELDTIAKRFAPSDPMTVELHGSPMRSGKGTWRSFRLEQRLGAMRDALNIITPRYPRNVRVFGAVVRKADLVDADPIEHAFEQISVRFDLFLRRLHNQGGDSQRGLIVFDKSSTERRIQRLARDFKYVGKHWGTTKNYAEVPVFLDSRASRLIQLADLIAFALFRRYESGDEELFGLIRNCFDAEGGLVRGLYERC